MTTMIDRWGNSLGIRLPKGIIEDAGLHAGDRVDVAVRKGAVMIRRAKPQYTLDGLLKGMTPDMAHTEVDFGEPVGNEQF